MHRTFSRRSFLDPLSPAASTASSAMPPVSAELHLLNRATFGPTPALLAEVEAMGIEAWVDQQLEPDEIEDGACETLVNHVLLAPTGTYAADMRLLVRAMHSKRQLAWRMTYFLNNHFCTYRGKTQPVSECTEDETFRKLCFATFRETLRASAQSPAMIDFLDSQTNLATSPNENYAREVMELHTIGVGNFTEADVVAIARVFTGWSRVNFVRNSVTESSYFSFRSTVHDSGPKTTSLGWSTPGFTGANGVNEGLSFLDFLAAHRLTAVLFVTKLCQYFVADQPPQGLLNRALAVFTKTGGSLKQTVRSILLDPEFGLGAKTKVMDGFEFVANAARRLKLAPRLLRLRNPASSTGFTDYNGYSSLATYAGNLRARPHENMVPTGYAETADDWQGPANELSRWDFSYNLTHNSISSANQLANQSTPFEQTLFVNPPNNPLEVLQCMLDWFVDGHVPVTTELALQAFVTARWQASWGDRPTWSQVQTTLRDLAGIILRLPESQLH